MLYKSLLALLFFSQILVAQTAGEKPLTEDEAKLKKEAVAFLRETMTDVNSMRSLENRISFTAEMAGLMWFHDEREGKGMFGGVAADFKELLLRYDAQMNSFGMPEPGEGKDFGGDIFAGFFSSDTSERSQVARKFTAAMSVRQQIAMSIAEHDPELAFSFYYDSVNPISNPAFRTQIDGVGNAYFESQLISQIAEKNAVKALPYAIKSLSKGVNYQTIDLLRIMHGKDAEKGAEFGSAIIRQLKFDKIASPDFYVISSILRFGAQTYDESKQPGGKRSALSLQELRELADIFGQAILERPSEDAFTALSYAEEIAKFAPSRAIQIRAKFKSKRRSSGSNISFGISNMTANMANMSVNSASKSTYAGNYDMSNSNSEYDFGVPTSADEKLLSDVKSIGGKEIDKEKRDKTIAQARKLLLATKGTDKKVAGLSMLAAQVAKSGDKKLAAEIMKDAEALVNPYPKNYQDFIYTWMLVAGYAEADPDRAFVKLEDTIQRANETISAFIKVGEFIDVAGMMISDGEVQVGSFGGQMVRGMTNDLKIAESTIQTLIHADFAKTKNLTNSFDRAEVRILAKMLVLRAVLGRSKVADKEDVIIDAPPEIPPADEESEPPA